MNYPRYYIAKRCIHWTAERNARFKLYQVDAGSDHVGRYAGHVYDGKLQRWVCVSHGISFSDISREATQDEIQKISQSKLAI